jgi:hypothetical protein
MLGRKLQETAAIISENNYRQLFSGKNYIQEQSSAKLLNSEVHLNKTIRRGGILERNIARNNTLHCFSSHCAI